MRVDAATSARIFYLLVYLIGLFFANNEPPSFLLNAI